MKEIKKIKNFTDLIVWQKAHLLVLEIYKITKLFPKEETYGLINQMRRAVISITSNIAEGFGRQGYKEKIQFYFIASGSLAELENQILVARDLKYFSPTQEIFVLCDDVYKLLNGLISASKKRKQY